MTVTARLSTDPVAAASQTVDDAAHDVVIVGGGLVGASLAIALERASVDVAMIEATPPGEMPAVFDQRSLGFADASVNALRALGVMAKLRLPTAAIRRIQVSRAGDFGRVRLDAAAYGRPAFGQVVVASDFGQALERRLCELPRLTRYRPARFIGLEPLDDGHRVLRIADDDGERRIRARLLVAADGSASPVRAALGIGVVREDYGQVLFVCRLRAERAPDGTAHERFTANGPTALLPRGDRHYGAVHAVAVAEAEAVAALDDAAFAERIQRVCGWRLGRILHCGPRSRYPALRLLARASTAPRAVLVGNAAQTLHPNGAQGFNLGLRDALTLAELIECHGLESLQDRVLDPYRRRRRIDREQTIAFSDDLARLTAARALAWSPLRSLGMLAIDRLPALQARLVAGAMGYRGEVPALCRAEGR